jgi:hypothetical protein
MAVVVNPTYFQSWLLAFALTQLVEMPVYRALARVTWARAFSLSLATHPIVWYVFPLLYERAALGWGATLWLGEAFAYLVEAALLRAYGVSWLRAIAVSCAANTASLVVGEVLRICCGIP